jgi:hypothetical protein
MDLKELAFSGILAAIAFRVFAQKTTQNSGKLVESAPETDEFAPADGVKGRDPNVSCAVPPPQMLSTSLLPANAEAMSDADFVGITPDKLQNVNLLSAGWSLGRDTQSSSMRNPSHDLRSEPVNPQTLTLENNSFLNSTITHPEFQRAFEPEPVADSEM